MAVSLLGAGVGDGAGDGTGAGDNGAAAVARVGSKMNMRMTLLLTMMVVKIHPQGLAGGRRFASLHLGVLPVSGFCRRVFSLWGPL